MTNAYPVVATQQDLRTRHVLTELDNAHAYLVMREPNAILAQMDTSCLMENAQPVIASQEDRLTSNVMVADNATANQVITVHNVNLA